MVNSFPGKIASSPATGTRSILLPRGLRIKGTGVDQKPVIKFVWPYINGYYFIRVTAIVQSSPREALHGLVNRRTTFRLRPIAGTFSDID